VEITPLSSVLLRLPVILLFLWLGLVFKRLFVREHLYHTLVVADLQTRTPVCSSA
jgi:hypothetical protein